MKKVRVKYVNWILKQDDSFLGPLISPITLTSMTCQRQEEIPSVTTNVLQKYGLSPMTESSL